MRLLREQSGLVFIAIHDGVGGHVRERLRCERRIEAALRWEGRATDGTPPDDDDISFFGWHGETNLTGWFLPAAPRPGVRVEPKVKHPISEARPPHSGGGPGSSC
jgi:hypothetical protein